MGSKLVLLILVSGFVLSGRSVVAQRTSTNLTGQSAIQHSGCSAELPRHCTEGLQLTFGAANVPTLLTLDFEPHTDGQSGAKSPAQIEVIVTANTPSALKPGLTFQLNRRRLPVPTRIDDRRSALVANFPFADFVRLVDVPTVRGTVFDTEFTATAEQMATLRFVVGRWASTGSMFVSASGTDRP